MLAWLIVQIFIASMAKYNKHIVACNKNTYKRLWNSDVFLFGAKGHFTCTCWEQISTKQNKIIAKVTDSNN